MSSKVSEKPTGSEMPNNSTTEDCSMVDCEYYKNPDYQRCMECKRKQADCSWK